MQTRDALAKCAEKYVDIAALSPQHQALVREFLYPALSVRSFTKSELIRVMFSTPELTPILESMTGKDLAVFLRCSESLLSQVLTQLQAKGGSEESLTRGRPKLLPEDQEHQLVGWIEERCSVGDWPTISAFKHRVFLALETVNPNITPSTQYFYDLCNRLTKGRFTLKVASGLDRERYDVSIDSIAKYFDELRRLEIKSVDPRLIINLDETGFGASKSGRIRPQKAIVPSDFKGNPVFKLGEECRFVSCLAATTASGLMLPPGLIANRKHDCDDASHCSFYQYCLRYFSAKGFVSREIFGHYITNCVLRYIDGTRSTLEDSTSQSCHFVRRAQQASSRSSSTPSVAESISQQNSRLSHLNKHAHHHLRDEKGQHDQENNDPATRPRIEIDNLKN